MEKDNNIVSVTEPFHELFKQQMYLYDMTYRGEFFLKQG